MTDNQNDDTETFIIKLNKSKEESIKKFDTESLVKSLLEKGSFFKVEEITRTGKRKNR